MIIFQSVVYVSFYLIIIRFDIEEAEICKVLKCSALSVNVVYHCVTQVFRW